MNPNAKITDEQFEAYPKQIRELAEGPFEEIQERGRGHQHAGR